MCLNADLRQRGSRLCLRRGDSAAILQTLARATGADAAFWNRRCEAAGPTIRLTAILDPVGLLGLTYWYALYPLHRYAFTGLLRGIVKAAEGDSRAKPFRG
jgi:deoxyribodipyrimidine photolyase